MNNISSTVNNNIHFIKYLTGQNGHDDGIVEANYSLSNLFYVLIIFLLSLIGTLANFIVISAYRLSINYKNNNGNNNNNNNGNNNYNYKNNFGSTYAIDELSGKKKYKINNIQQQQQQQPFCLYKSKRSISQNIAPHSYTPMIPSNLHLNLNNNNNTMGNANKMNLNKIRRTLCSYFILSLGFCDIIICLVNLPLNALIEVSFFQNYFSQIAFNSRLDVMCKLSYFFLQIPIILEIEILFTIALDRYSSVFKPIKLYFFDINKLIVTLAIQLACASLLSMPNLLFITKNTADQDAIDFNKTPIFFPLKHNIPFTFCKVNDSYKIMYNWYQSILCLLFFINLLVISIFYVKVYKHIYEASKNQRLQNASSTRRSSVAVQTPVPQSQVQPLTHDNYNSSSLVSTQLQKQQTCNDSTLTTSNAQEHSSLNNQYDSQETTANQRDQHKQKMKHILRHFKFKTSFEKPSNDLIASHDLNANASEKSSLKRRYSALNFKRQTALDKNNSLQMKVKSLEGSGYTTNSFRTCNDNKKLDISPRRLSVPVILSTSVLLQSCNKKVADQSHQLNQQRLLNDEKKAFKSKSLLPNQHHVSSNEIFDSQNRLFRRHISRPFKHGKTARILGMSTLTLLLTWLPYWYYVVLKESKFFDHSDNYTRVNSGYDESILIFNQSKYYLKKLLKNLFYLNYVLNPFFYSFVNHRFRQNVYNLFFKFHICKNLKIFQKFKKFIFSY